MNLMKMSSNSPKFILSMLRIHQSFSLVRFLILQYIYYLELLIKVTTLNFNKIKSITCIWATFRGWGTNAPPRLAFAPLGSETKIMYKCAIASNLLITIHCADKYKSKQLYIELCT